MKLDKLVVNASPVISLAKIGFAEPLFAALCSNGFRISEDIMGTALRIDVESH